MASMTHTERKRSIYLLRKSGGARTRARVAVALRLPPAGAIV